MKKAVVVLAILICLFIVIKRIAITEEGRIKKIIASGEKAVENKNLLRCLSYVSSDYSDNLGNDYSRLSYLLRETFRIYQDIFVHIRGLEIEVEEDKAVATLVATVFVSRTGKEKEGLFKESGTDRFIITFRKEDGNWKIIRVEAPEPTFE